MEGALHGSLPSAPYPADSRWLTQY